MVLVALVTDPVEVAVQYLGRGGPGHDAQRVQRMHQGLDDDTAAGRLGIVLPGEATGLEPLLEIERNQRTEFGRARKQLPGQRVEADGLRDAQRAGAIGKGLLYDIGLRGVAGKRLLDQQRQPAFGHREGQFPVTANRYDQDRGVDIVALQQVLPARLEGDAQFIGQRATPDGIAPRQHLQARTRHVAGDEVARVARTVAAGTDQAET